MANEMMSLSIDKAMLTPVIEQQVKLIMTELLGGQELIVDKVIKNAINAKVDENGKPTSYGGRPFYEYLLTEEIKKAVMEAMAEEVKSRAGKILDFLYKRHFDVYGLIPKGMAIEVTPENNPYNQ